MSNALARGNIIVVKKNYWAIPEGEMRRTASLERIWVPEIEVIFIITKRPGERMGWVESHTQLRNCKWIQETLHCGFLVFVTKRCHFWPAIPREECFLRIWGSNFALKMKSFIHFSTDRWVWRSRFVIFSFICETLIIFATAQCVPFFDIGSFQCQNIKNDSS